MHHHRHFFYRLLWSVRRAGYAIWATTLLLFLFAVAVFWPIQHFLGHTAGSSAVWVLLGACVVWALKRRGVTFPPFFRAPSGRRLLVCYAALAAAVPVGVVIAAMLRTHHG